MINEDVGKKNVDKWTCKFIMIIHLSFIIMYNDHMENAGKIMYIYEKCW